MKDIKKYIIGFIIGISFIMGYTFAANNGSIGALFSDTTSYSNFSTVWNKITIGGVKTNEIKLGTWIVSEDASNNLKFSNGTKSVTLGSDGSVTSTEYKY